MNEYPGIKIIAARSDNGIIGDKGRIPWRCSADLARFRRLTVGGTVIMGRKTWNSLPPRHRPLAGRHNVLLTRSQIDVRGDMPPDTSAIVVNDLAIALVSWPDAWVIGGAEVYRYALPYARWLFLTIVRRSVHGDTYMPPVRYEDWDRVEIDALPEKNDEPAATVFVMRRRGEPATIRPPHASAAEPLPQGP